MDAIKETYEALELCTDDDKRLKLLFNLATGLLNFDNKRSMEVAEEISALAERMDSNLGRSYCHTAKARVYYKRAQYSDAMAEFEKASETAMLTTDRTHQAICLDSLGIAFRYQKRFKESEACSLKALEILKELSTSSAYMGICYNNLGCLYKDLEDYGKATETYKEGLKVALASKDYQMAYNLLNNLGGMAITLGNFADGLDYAQQALTGFQKIKHKHGEVHAMVFVGHCLLGLGHYAKAMEKYLTCIKLLKNVDNKLIEIQAYKGLGDVYARMLAYNEANLHYTKALDVSQLIGDHDETCELLLCIGNANFALNKIPEAIEAFNMGIALANKNELTTNLAKLTTRQKELGLE